MRQRLLMKNTTSALFFQITTIICGFILPRLILWQYGSNVNGLINSISQFLQIITFLELGVGAVVQSSLYKPLADENNVEISRVITSSSKFFRTLGYILIVYVALLIIIYPQIISKSFGYIYTAILILAMSVSFFSQYFFGIVDRLLLTADQRGYIQYNFQTLTVILNTILCAVLIYFNCSIQTVKLCTAAVYLIRPCALRLYINHKYNINRKETYSEEPIKQKWNGVAQHVSAVVLDGTDNIVLTFFSTLSSVSIYSVYFLVVYGVKQLFLSLTNGFQALVGELWAKKELDTLNVYFGWIEWAIHTSVTLIFTCTGILLVPFISVYTFGIKDANYIQPLFGAILTLANAMHCMRLPYNMMILAGGHYKQTQNSFIIAAFINIVISILMLLVFGLVGVAIGTLCAMMYQTIWMIIYNSKNFIRWPIKKVIKQFCVDILCTLLVCAATKWISLNECNYTAWVAMSIKVCLIAIIIVLITNCIFYKDYMASLVSNVLHKKRINGGIAR